MLIQAGDKVPADGLLIEGSIKVSQAALNGESREETKVEADSLQEADSTDYNCPVKVFMGSVVTSGEAYMVATVIGGESELGKINASLNDKVLRYQQIQKWDGKYPNVVSDSVSVLMNLPSDDADSSSTETPTNP